MILLFHIVVALASMAYTAYTYIAPSPTKLYTSYVLAGTTFATGSFLLVQNPSHLVSACVTGLIYFGIVGAIIFATRRKLVVAANQS